MSINDKNRSFYIDIGWIFYL
uniref:Uncharacterized protein n=1 Tax=Rhizophora mucronata TaxID=61149 RepID=A0A2P2NJ07_RHIMU